MITINLTKLESALEQVKKSFPKLKPADQALVANALVVAGRHAVAVVNDRERTWPDDYQELTDDLVTEILAVQDQLDEPKKTKRTTKTTDTEEPIPLAVEIKPNIEAGEMILEERDDLKTVLSDALDEGVEYVYGPQDIGWQWALEHANWSTLSEDAIQRKVKIRVNFTGGATGSEVGASGKPRRKK